MNKHTHIIMNKDALRSMCIDSHRSTCTDVSTESAGFSTASVSVQGSMCPYISTKGTDVHIGTSTDISTVKMVVRIITNTYDKYEDYKPKQYICTDSVGKVRNGISYDDDLQ